MEDLKKVASFVSNIIETTSTTFEDIKEETIKNFYIEGFKHFGFTVNDVDHINKELNTNFKYHKGEVSISYPEYYNPSKRPDIFACKNGTSQYYIIELKKPIQIDKLYYSCKDTKQLVLVPFETILKDAATQLDGYIDIISLCTFDTDHFPILDLHPLVITHISNKTPAKQFLDEHSPGYNSKISVDDINKLRIKQLMVPSIKTLKEIKEMETNEVNAIVYPYYTSDFDYNKLINQ